MSRKGRTQADRVDKHFRRVHEEGEPYLVSSPKRRCIETLEPLAQSHKSKIVISDLLQEQSESDRAFRERLERFGRWWREEAPDLVVACSHGDWIPPALQMLTGVVTDLKKGGWAEVWLEEGECKLRWLLQELK